MALCNKCQDLDVYDAMCKVQASGGGDFEFSPPAPARLIRGWHDSLQDILKASEKCTLCSLVIKGWYNDREVVVAEKLRSGDIPISSLPENIYDKFPTMERYQESKVLIFAERVSATPEDVGVDGRLEAQFFLQVALWPLVQSSFDHYDKLHTAFRITSSDGWYCLCYLAHANDVEFC